MSKATDWDHRIIDGTSLALGGEIGHEDDVERLRGILIVTDQEGREKTLAEIAVAFIRWAQDLKAERNAAREARD